MRTGTKAVACALGQCTTCVRAQGPGWTTCCFPSVFRIILLGMCDVPALFVLGYVACSTKQERMAAWLYAQADAWGPQVPGGGDSLRVVRPRGGGGLLRYYALTTLEDTEVRGDVGGIVGGVAGWSVDEKRGCLVVERRVES